MTERTATFKRVLSVAYKEILDLGIRNMPFDARSIMTENLIICSAQEYSEKTKINVSCLLDKFNIHDGFIYRGITHGINLIMYDGKEYTRRTNFTIFHELSHLILGHAVCGKEQEAEANLCASEMIAPLILLRAIEQKGHRLRPNMIMTCFYMSQMAAEYKLDELRFNPHIETEFDSRILRQFYDYLTYVWPSNRINASAIDIFVD